MPGETPSQPGWYPDQNGTMRWFDGNAWTDHVQPGASGGVPGSEPTMVQPSTPNPTQHLEQQPGWQGGLPPGGPPSGPPPGAPGSAYGAVPQPSFPGAPGGPGGPPPGFPPPSSGGGNKGLLIILAVVGAIVLVAVLAVGSWAVFVRDDDGDNDRNSDGGDNGSLPDTSPEDVAEQFMDGVLANDCAVLEELVTDRLLEEEGGCEVEDMPSEFTYTVSPAAIDEAAETAVVPVVLSFSGGSETSPITLAMVLDEDEWKVDEIIEAGSTDVPTDSTDSSTVSPDVPTDTPDSPDIDTPSIPELPDIPTDPSELESYLSDYFSDFLTYTG